jgi:hypothetical protein
MGTVYKASKTFPILVGQVNEQIRALPAATDSVRSETLREIITQNFFDVRGGRANLSTSGSTK